MPVILASGALVGCDTSSNGIEITLKTTAGSSTITVLENAAAAFMETEDGEGITVTVEKYSGDYSSLASNQIQSFAAGTHADMVMVYPDAVANFIDYGYAYNLEPYMYDEDYGWSDEDLADILPTFLEEGTKYVVEGTYSLPFSKSTEVMYYNANLIGQEIPGINDGNPITESYIESLTWDELFNVFCPAFIQYMENNPNQTLLDTTANDTWAIVGYDSDDNLFITLAEQYGIPYTSVDYDTGTGSFDFVNDEMIELVNDWVEYYSKGYVLTAGTTGNRANDYFKTDSILFSIGSTAGASYQWQSGMDVRVAPIPGAYQDETGGEATDSETGYNNHCILQGPSMAFLRHRNSDGEWDTDRQLASWKFYKYLTNYENNLNWATTANYMPIRQSIYDGEEYTELYNASQYNSDTYDALTCRVATEAGEVTDRFYTSPAFPGSSECRDAVGALMTAALNLGSGTWTTDDIAELFDDAYDECIAAL